MEIIYKLVLTNHRIIFSIASELSSRRHLENLGLHPSLNTLMQIDQLYHMLYAGKYLQSKFVTRQVKLISNRIENIWYSDVEKNLFFSSRHFRLPLQS